MTRRFRLFALAAAAVSIGACQAKPPHTTSAPAAPVAMAPAPPPKMATMICRNSQTGASVECGSPNAVPVAVETR